MPPFSRFFSSSVSMRLLTSCLQMSSNDSATPEISGAPLRQFVSAPCTRRNRKSSLPLRRIGRLLRRPARRRLLLRPELGLLRVGSAAGFVRFELHPRQQIARLASSPASVCSNRCRNTNSRASSIARNCSGVTTSSSHRSLLATFGPCAQVAKVGRLHASPTASGPASTPSSRTSNASSARL